MRQRDEPARLGKRLGRARQERGLTQQEVADKLGCFQSTVAFIETGKRAVSALELATMARLYGVSADALLGLDTTDCPASTRVLAPSAEAWRGTPHGCTVE